VDIKSNRSQLQVLGKQHRTMKHTVFPVPLHIVVNAVVADNWLCKGRGQSSMGKERWWNETVLCWSDQTQNRINTNVLWAVIVLANSETLMHHYRDCGVDRVMCWTADIGSFCVNEFAFNCKWLVLKHSVGNKTWSFHGDWTRWWRQRWSPKRWAFIHNWHGLLPKKILSM
jgi:hypothetical protein